MKYKYHFSARLISSLIVKLEVQLQFKWHLSNRQFKINYCVSFVPLCWSNANWWCDGYYWNLYASWQNANSLIFRLFTIKIYFLFVIIDTNNQSRSFLFRRLLNFHICVFFAIILSIIDGLFISRNVLIREVVPASSDENYFWPV